MAKLSGSKIKGIVGERSEEIHEDSISGKKG